MSVMLDQRWQIIGASMLAGRARLRLEVETGLTSSVSTLKIVKRNWGVVSNTKAGALLEMDAFKQGWDLALDYVSTDMTEEEMHRRSLVERHAYKGRKRILQEQAYERGYYRFMEIVGSQQQEG